MMCLSYYFVFTLLGKFLRHIYFIEKVKFSLIFWYFHRCEDVALILGNEISINEGPFEQRAEKVRTIQKPSHFFCQGILPQD